MMSKLASTSLLLSISFCSPRGSARLTPRLSLPSDQLPRLCCCRRGGFDGIMHSSDRLSASSQEFWIDEGLSPAGPQSAIGSSTPRVFEPGGLPCQPGRDDGMRVPPSSSLSNGAARVMQGNPIVGAWSSQGHRRRSTRLHPAAVHLLIWTTLLASCPLHNRPPESLSSSAFFCLVVSSRAR